MEREDRDRKRDAAPTARRSLPQERMLQRTARILAVSAQLLAAEGAPALNTNRIARAAKVPVGAVYELFPNKQAIALALLDDLAERETQQVLARLDEVRGMPLRQAVVAMVELAATLLGAHYPLYRSLWEIAPVARSIGPRPLQQKIIATIGDVLTPEAAALGIADVNVASWVVYQIVESLMVQAVSQDDLDREACVTAIAKAVLDYLRVDG